jgi:hypothetical protein
MLARSFKSAEVGGMTLTSRVRLTGLCDLQT